MIKYKEEDRGYETPCWIWQGALSKGYGLMKHPASNRTISVHKYLFEKKYGRVVESSKVLDHLCNQKACVNPSHLKVVLIAQNIRRSKAAILNEDRVKRVKELVSKGESKASIARGFGVHRNTISDITRGKTWNIE